MAMDCKELMIGDWLFCTSAQCNVQVKAMPINGVYGKGYRIIIDNDDFELVLREKHFDPIPLTAEILEKNGYKDERSNYALRYDKYHICIYLADKKLSINSYGAVLDIHCRYVHQLQHALRLCGISKEIEL